MKAVLISIQPKWVEKIANGQKTIEVRKTAPKCEEPFKCYIYVTKAKKWFHSGIIVTSDELLWLSSDKIKMCDGFELWADGEYYQCVNCKVIGGFVCDKIDEIVPDYNPVTAKFYYGYVADTEATCLSEEELQKYGKNKSLYFWHISDLKIYDKPKELREFFKPCPTKEKGDCLDCDCLADNDYGGICTNNLTRPPQSWCYVEE